MVIKKFPNEKEAKELGGFLVAPFTFCRVFTSNPISLENGLLEINAFLVENGYDAVNSKDLNEEPLCHTKGEHKITLELNPWTESVALYLTDEELERFYHDLRQEGE